MRRLGVTLIIGCASLAIAAPSASATVDRAEYASQVNSICSSANSAYKQALKGFPKSGPPGSLAKLIRRVNKAYGKIVDRIALVAPAPGDEALVAAWVASLRRIEGLNQQAAALIRKAFAALKKGKVKAAIGHFKKLERNEKRTLDAASLSAQQGTELGATACFE